MMTPTLNKFAARLAELQGTSQKLKYAEGPPRAATIPAQHEAVGDITIYDDGDELTIEIGQKYHTHISCRNYDRHPKAERLNIVARDAAEFVNDVICNRVCISVDFIGDRCIGGSHFYLNEDQNESSLLRVIAAEAKSDEARSERFLWSGPIT